MPGQIGIFLSYATEDRDIVKAFDAALRSISGSLSNSIKVFFDYKSIDAGSSISEEIQDALRRSHYLFVFYTGIMKRSHSWTGMELGYYQALKNNGEPDDIERRVIPIYLGNPPDSLDDNQGIKLIIAPEDLDLTRDEYKTLVNSRAEAIRQSQLTNLLKQIARQANPSPPDSNASELADYQTALSEKMTDIEAVIVPKIWVDMYDCVGSRVAKRTIEQKLIEFSIDGTAMKSRTEGVPDEAKIVEHGNALKIFGIDGHAKTFTWKAFSKELDSLFREQSPAIKRAIEGVFDSALSSFTPIDNGRLVLSPTDNKIYRIIVTRHFDYFNGSKIVHMYFIEKWRDSGHGDEETTLLLSILNIAARYRFIFIERSSDLSWTALKIIPDDQKLKASIHRLMQEIILVEDESTQLNLSSVKAITALFGNNFDEAVITNMQTSWSLRRNELKASAELFLATPFQSAEYEKTKEAWFSALRTFTDAAQEMNTLVGKQALNRLQDFF